MALGIDFGDTYCKMALCTSAGCSEAIADAEGHDRTPSVVSYHSTGVLVGAPSEDRLVEQPLGAPTHQEEVVTGVKYDLATSPVLALPGGRVTTPVDVVADVL